MAENSEKKSTNSEKTQNSKHSSPTIETASAINSPYFYNKAKNSESHPPRKDFPKTDFMTDPNNTFYFPPWNPTNDPNDVSVSDAFKVYARCCITNAVPSRAQRFIEPRRLDCSRLFDDVVLAIKVRRSKNENEQRRLLEDAYPWVCDSTQGFKHRHVWKFRERPPEYFDDPSMSDDEYLFLRETLVRVMKTSIFSEVHGKFVQPRFYSLARMTPKELFCYFRSKSQNFGKEGREESDVESIQQTERNLIELISKNITETNSEDSNKGSKGSKLGPSLSREEQREELEEVRDLIAEVAQNIEETESKGRNKKEYHSSMERLLGYSFQMKRGVSSDIENNKKTVSDGYESTGFSKKKIIEKLSGNNEKEGKNTVRPLVTIVSDFVKSKIKSAGFSFSPSSWQIAKDSNNDFEGDKFKIDLQMDDSKTKELGKGKNEKLSENK